MSLDLGRLLEESGAILHGHFLLTSGRHSDVYFEKFRLLEQPRVLTALCGEVASHFRPGVGQGPEAMEGIQYVAGPTTGGIIIAFEVARQMGAQAVYIETEAGVKKLRRGKTLPAGARVLVVDDVLTTGKSVLEVIEVIRGAGASVAGVAVLIDRAESPVDFGCPFFAAYKVEAKSYAPDQVPDSLRSVPITKPGTRVAR